MTPNGRPIGGTAVAHKTPRCPGRSVGLCGEPAAEAAGRLPTVLLMSARNRKGSQFRWDYGEYRDTFASLDKAQNIMRPLFSRKLKQMEDLVLNQRRLWQFGTRNF